MKIHIIIAILLVSLVIAGCSYAPPSPYDPVVHKNTSNSTTNTSLNLTNSSINVNLTNTSVQWINNTTNQSYPSPNTSKKYIQPKDLIISNLSSYELTFKKYDSINNTGYGSTSAATAYYTVYDTRGNIAAHVAHFDDYSLSKRYLDMWLENQAANNSQGTTPVVARIAGNSVWMIKHHSLSNHTFYVWSSDLDVVFTSWSSYSGNLDTDMDAAHRSLLEAYLAKYQSDVKVLIK